MHILTLNITALLIALWRGTIDCDPKDSRETWDWVVLTGAVWKAHGAAVAAARCYLPGSFDRPPRDPAETINSGYKAWEFCLWIFGLGPALLHGILPHVYWKHFCKLVYAIRILQQHSIRAEQLPLAHRAILEFTEEFEELYCQGKPERIHFVRQCVHGLSHLAPEVMRIGPGALASQWTLENTIGNLGREIKQDHHYYANLEQRAVCRASVNALKVGIPDIEPDRPYNQERRLPRGAYDIGDGFVLLTAKDRYAHTFRNEAAAAIRTYMEKSNIDLEEGWRPRYKRWARLRLPNGHIRKNGILHWDQPIYTVLHRYSCNSVVLCRAHSTHASCVGLRRLQSFQGSFVVLQSCLLNNVVLHCGLGYDYVYIS
ncbi:hypothetical protein OF83DRAFT_1071358 [Amylostereum chailletii]|nr:hypothetical protein OF83DRAFT_1071358 [Amylostereum chailletii]